MAEFMKIPLFEKRNLSRFFFNFLVFKSLGSGLGRGGEVKNRIIGIIAFGSIISFSEFSFFKAVMC
jgi:hypothetical protein